MGVLSGRQIREMANSGKIKIDPFDQSLIQPATYDLRLGPKILASPLNAEKLGAVIDLHLEHSYKIQPGQMVGVLSLEKLFLPLDVAGRFGIRSSIARKGINAFGGVQLDPGFRGRLVMNLLNVGPEPITITYCEPIFSVEFSRLEEEAEASYSGPYQDQDDFPADQYNYILSARTTSLAEIPTFRKDIKRLNVLIEELTARIPDPDEGLIIREEIKTRLLASSNLPPSELLTPEEMRRQISYGVPK